MTAQPPSPEDQPGVLLYYHYIKLGNGNTQQEVAEWIQDLCKRLNLKGRVRVAEDGLNVTLGGRMSDLRSHMSSVKAHPLFCDADIDFKLAASQGPVNSQTSHETGFTALQVKLCKELVTLGPLAEGRADPHTNAAPHLTPQQFHAMLQQAACTASPAAPASSHTPACDSQGPGDTEQASWPQESPATVLLDARNIYETRVGHFTQAGVPLLDPRTRCFSELPLWMETHAHKLKDKRVLMYCTGGVRCERASAYLQELGVKDVYQLQGGIQRYLEAFPDGGLFQGKNFVYDDRVLVGPAQPLNATPTLTSSTPGVSTARDTDHPTSDAPAANSQVVGRCMVCHTAWDDYGARVRCSHCRLLLLVCEACQPQVQPPQLVCELCQERQQPAQLAGNSTSPLAASAASHPPPAQSAHGPDPSPVSRGSPHGAAAAAGQEGPGGLPHMGGRKLRILCLHGFRHTASGFHGRTHAFRHKLRDIAEFHFVDAPHPLPYYYKIQPSNDTDTSERQPSNPCDDGVVVQEPGSPALPGEARPPATAGGSPPGLPDTHGKRRRAWMVSPELLHWQQGDMAQGGWEVAPDYVDSEQHLHQTEGWPAALQTLLTAVREHGPFDGVLGFSQGAGVAALLCAHLQQQRHEASGDTVPAFQFAVLASGYPPPGSEAQAMLRQAGVIQTPSLHLFGGETAQDRQIGASESLALAMLFEPSDATLFRHGAGHIIPGTRAVADAVRKFLGQFL